MQNIIWVPTVLAFAADSFAYSINLPHLAYNPIYTALMIIFMYWCAIVITLRGLNLSSIITAIGAIFGVLIPSLVVIYLGIKWIISGQPINISITPTNFFPDFSKLDNISFAAGIVLLFGGMEVNAVHVNELRKPTTQYLKSLIISVIIILIIFFLGYISLAVIVPQDSISLTSGIMQALHLALKMYNLEWLVNVLGMCIALGVVCCIITWICGPSKGMLVAAQDGVIPRILAYKNKHGIQRNILIIQGILVALFSLLVIFIGNINEVYFLLTEMAATLYLMMYVLMFVAAIRLRYTKPNIPRTYTVPGGIIGLWFICLLGISSCIFAFIFAFLPPGDLGISSPKLYIGILIANLVFCLFLSRVIYRPNSNIESKKLARKTG